MATSVDFKVMEHYTHNDELCCGANIFQHLPVERRLQIVYIYTTASLIEATVKSICEITIC